MYFVVVCVYFREGLYVISPVAVNKKEECNITYLIRFNTFFINVIPCVCLLMYVYI